MEIHLTSLTPLHRTWCQSWQISHLMYLVLSSILFQTEYVAFLCFAGMTHSSSPYLFVFLELRVFWKSCKSLHEAYQRKFILFERLVKLEKKYKSNGKKNSEQFTVIFVNKIFIYLISTLTAFMLEFCWRFHTHLLKSC